MKKRLLSILLAALMICSLLPVMAAAAEWTGKPATVTGSGTEADPYVIMTSDELGAFADAVSVGNNMSGMYFKLGADIGSEETPFTKMIGTKDKPFSGNFDGNGHTVTVNINAAASNAGLFYENRGTISNLTVAGTVSVTGTAAAGGIAYSNTKTINNCCNKAAVSADTANNYCGGIASDNTGTIVNCRNEGAISGQNASFGGIAGIMRYSDAKILNSYNLGTVATTGGSSSIVGGLCAVFSDKSSDKDYGVTIQNSYNAGEVASSNNNMKGSLVGYISRYKEYHHCTACYFNNEVNPGLAAYGTSSGDVSSDNYKATGLTTDQCKGAAGTTDALIDELNKGRADHDDWYEWVIDSATGYPTLLPPSPHTHTVDDVETTFQPWTNGTSLPDSPGNYYLDTDVNLTSGWYVPMGTEGSPATTNLCLNGHYIKGSISNWPLVYIRDYAILNIYDEENTAAHKFSVGENNLWVYERAWNSASDVESEAVKKVTGGFVSSTSIDIIFINPNGKLTINGGTYTGAYNNEGAIYNKGTFIMNAGTICGNYNHYGDGGAVYNDGTFIMNGGTISNNNSKTAGGGIVSGYNASNALFEMHGGTIEGNKATNYGGALYLFDGTATITGGIIQNNKAAYGGGGVYNYGGNFTLGGTAVIQGNSLTSGGVNNVELLYENITIDTGAAEPCDGMSIGIKGSGAFTTNGSAAYVKYFTSDDPTYYVDFDSTESKLVLELVESGKYAVTVNTDGNGVVYTDKQTAASGDTVTLTVSANEGYELESLTVTGVSNENITDNGNGTYTFTMPNQAATVTVSFVKSGPSIKVKKIADNPKYGETKTDYQLYTVTTPNFASTPELTLQWQKVVGEIVTWDSSAPNGVTLGTDGRVTISAAVPAGSYVFRITNSKPETVDTPASGTPNPEFVTSSEITLTIDKADPDIGTVSQSNTIYDSETLASAATKITKTGNTAGTFSLTGTTPLADGSYSYTFTPTDTSNYNTATGSVSLAITADTLQSISVGDTRPTTTTYKYGESFSKTGLTVTATYLSGTTADVTASTTFAPPAFTTIDTTGNTSVTLSYGDKTCTVGGLTVNKLDATDEMKALTSDLMATAGSTVSIPLNLPSGASASSATVNAARSSYVNAQIQSNNLVLTVTTAIPNTDTFAVTVPVTGADIYNDYTITVTVTPVFKTVVTINAAASSYTYGTNGTGYTGLSVTDNYVATSALEFLYESTGATPTYSSSSAPTNAGTYKVTISVPAGNAAYTGSTVVNFEVYRKQVTVTAKDITVYVGEDAPALDSSDYTVSGLVGGDTLDGITLQYETTPDTSAVGTYTILAIDNQANGRRNYDVTCVNGTLTISSKPSSGGGSSSYAVTVNDAKNGTVSADKKSASSGSTVTITVTPDKGFTLETLTVLDKNGKEVEVKSLGENKFSFKMPRSKVTVNATFMEDNSMLNFCVDVKASDYYYDAVLWAYENEICTGTDAVHFSPAAPVTRAQVVTFLWRAAGKPVVNYAMNMSDVASGKYYTEAVRWALSEGITKGTDETHFSPNATCTRAQIVSFLYRYAKAAANETANPFTDVAAGAYYYDAVLWAAENGITGGKTATTFAPADPCTRAQVVTFIYRYMAK